MGPFAILCYDESMKPLSLLNLNIERRKHLALVKPFLAQQHFDVVCLQEVMEGTVAELATELGMVSAFAPRVGIQDQPDMEGMAILSRYPIKSQLIVDYGGFFGAEEEQLKAIHKGRPTQPLLITEIEQDQQLFRIATTHFTWSDHGEITEKQRVNMAKLLKAMESYSELVLVGDFNTPRGKELYTDLSTAFTDTLPADVVTTIDGERHRAGALQLVVDGMFSRGYRVEEVQVHTGLSDHCGISGLVSPA